MHRPELAVLDEPTSGLDPLLQAEFRTLLRETAADGRTVFLSSHSLDEVQHAADRVGIIRSGRLIDVDRVETLRERALRHVAITFAGPVDPPPFAALDGVRVERVDASLRLSAAEAAMDAVVKAAARHRSSTSSPRRPISRRSSSTSTGRPTTPTELLRRGLRDHRRALVGWCARRRCVRALIAAIFPSIEGSTQLDELIESYPDALKSLSASARSITSGPGFLDAELFSSCSRCSCSCSRSARARGRCGRGGCRPAGARPLVSGPRGARRAREGSRSPSRSGSSARHGRRARAARPRRRARPGRSGRRFGAVGSQPRLLYGWLALAVGRRCPAGRSRSAFLPPRRRRLPRRRSARPRRLARPVPRLSSFWWVGRAAPERRAAWGVLVVAAAALACRRAAALVDRRGLKVP